MRGQKPVVEVRMCWLLVMSDSGNQIELIKMLKCFGVCSRVSLVCLSQRISFSLHCPRQRTHTVMTKENRRNCCRQPDEAVCAHDWFCENQRAPNERTQDAQTFHTWRFHQVTELVNADCNQFFASEVLERSVRDGNAVNYWEGNRIHRFPSNQISGFW